MKQFLLASVVTLLAPAAFAQTLFLDNATIVQANGKRSTADIIWSDGDIAQQGANLTAPQGAETVTGAWVTPGLFTAMSNLGLTDLGSNGPGNDIRAADAPTSVSERAADSFNPRSPYIANTRGRGITHAVVAPGTSGNSIFAGTGAIIELTGEFDSVLIEEAFVYLTLGESGGSRAGGSRAAAMAQLRAAISDAEGFLRRYNDAPDGGDVLSRQDANALRKAVSGDIPFMVQADRASDLIALIRLKAENPKLNIIVTGAAEAWDVADALAAADIRVVIDPLENLPTSFEAVGARLDNVLFLEKAGVDYAIANLTSFRVAKPASLGQHAGNAVGEGLAWDKAFAAISSVPASWFGIDSKTTVVWDGDPLEATSAPLAVTINGTEMPMNSRIKALRDRYNPTNNDTRPYKYR